MTLLEALRAFLRELFGISEPESEPESTSDLAVPSSPATYSGHGADVTTLEVSVHQSASLTERRGRVPEQNVVRFLGRALREAGYNYRITFGSDPVSGDFSSADGAALDRWAGISYDADHVNLLLHAEDHNGVAYVGMKAAIAPGGEMDRLVERVDSAEGPVYRNVRAALHEVGHTLGGTHADGMIPSPHLLYQNVEDGWMDSPSRE